MTTNLCFNQRRDIINNIVRVRYYINTRERARGNSRNRVIEHGNMLGFDSAYIKTPSSSGSTRRTYDEEEEEEKSHGGVFGGVVAVGTQRF